MAGKGNPKTGGRKKGTQNRFTNLQNAFLEAFQDIGGVSGLAQWGKKAKNKADFYKLVAKMLPREVNVQVEGTLTLAEKIRSARTRSNKD